MAEPLVGLMGRAFARARAVPTRAPGRPDGDSRNAVAESPTSYRFIRLTGQRRHRAVRSFARSRVRLRTFRHGHFPGAVGEAQQSGGGARYTHLVLFHRDEVRSVRARIEFLGIRRHDSIRGFWMLFAYFGPEAMMPVASVIAAGVGVVMMFGRSIVVFGLNLVDRVRPHPRRR
jgi:hypothetical protein